LRLRRRSLSAGDGVGPNAGIISRRDRLSAQRPPRWRTEAGRNEETPRQDLLLQERPRSAPETVQTRFPEMTWDGTTNRHQSARRRNFGLLRKPQDALRFGEMEMATKRHRRRKEIQLWYLFVAHDSEFYHVASSVNLS